MRYHQECTSPAFPGDPQTAPENYRYFTKIVERYQTHEARGLQRERRAHRQFAAIAEILKTKVEAAGFDEVILYFNLGLKPATRVKDEMSRFMTEVAPAFPPPRQ